ncbi:unnamed protein product [Ilex paraguariensis]|uniref:Proton pump-interactor 1 n=1 Tax=Ilex paraguariensis TaxID=185542 RepID=A0ABC8URK1_9AQUA
MTAETEVLRELSEVSLNGEIEETRGLDKSFYQDLPKADGSGCNGIKHVDEDDHDADESGRDDPDNSYVFVNENGHASDDPNELDLNAESNVVTKSKAIEVQVGELNVDDAQIVPSSAEQNNCIVDLTDVTQLTDDVSPESLEGKVDKDGVEVVSTNRVEEPSATVGFEPEQGAGEVNIEGRLALESAPDPEETQESEANVSNSAEDLGESRKFKILSSVADGSSDIKVEYEKQINVGSIEELGEGKEFQMEVFEAPEYETPEVKVGEVKSEVTTKLELAIEPENIMESEITFATPAEYVSCQLVNGDGRVEEEIIRDLDILLKQKQKSQVLVTNDIQADLDQGREATELANEIDSPLETEGESVLDENKGNLPTSCVEGCISQTEKHNEARSLPSPTDYGQKAPEPNGSSEKHESLSSPTVCVKPEVNNGSVPIEIGDILLADSEDGTTGDQEVRCRNFLVMEDLPSSGANVTEPETQVENSDIKNCESVISCAEDAQSEILMENGNGPVEGESILSCPDNDVLLQSEAASVEHEKNIPTFPGEYRHMESLVSNGDIEHAHRQSISANNLEPECHVSDSVQNGSSADVKSGSTVENFSVISGRDMPSNIAVVSGSEVLDGPVVNSADALNTAPVSVSVGNGEDQSNGESEGGDGKLKCVETMDSEAIHRDGTSTSLPEGSSADDMHGQNGGAEATTRPFRFLIRIPRFDDGNLREQIRQAQLQVDEKTKCRDAIRVEIQKKKANCQVHGDEYDAANAEVKASRKLVKAKRQEIDSVQSMINRVKNAISVEDIDARINNVEHMIEHETLPLKEEKQFIREIKQLRHLRGQLSSNMGSRDEVQQALQQKDQVEERLKILRKELDCLKDKVSKAEAAAVVGGKKYEDESKRLKELQAQFRAADDIRQQAYSHFSSLRVQLLEKNQHFRMYKDDSMAASRYGSTGDSKALHRKCVNQVESLMQLWNKNDEFRKEYVRFNTRSTLRRLGTLDSRALGPDEEPPLVPSYADERVDRLASSPVKANPLSPTLTLEQEKQVSPVEGEVADGKSIAKVAEYNNHMEKTKKSVKPILASGSATFSGRDDTEETKEEEHMQTKEELELARKAEDLRKEEAAAKLKEQCRLEEKAKAKEALERKKRNAEKAQIRADVRAQKEAEQKEKEREKKLRKKERKKAAAAEAHDGITDGEIAPTSETLTRTFKVVEIKDTHSATTKRPSRPSQFTKQSKTKSIPPPLRNRGKSKLQQWGWVILAALVLIILFFVGNIGFYSTLKLRRGQF